jgi:hypothetical protein
MRVWIESGAATNARRAEPRQIEMTFLRIVIPIYLLFEHDLFGKPVPTFPDHALATLR